jgi:hypothetical protein
MERELLQKTQIIISTAVEGVRSTGDVLSTGYSSSAFSRFDTIIVDAGYLEEYSQYISASGNREMLDNVGAISLDGLFVPYSTNELHSGRLPHFETPTDLDSGSVTVRSLNPFNPSNMFGTGVVNTGTTDSGSYLPSVWQSGGHNITAALTNSSNATEDSLEAKTHPVSNFFDADFYYRKKTELQDIKSVAHRAPLILSGPGYDIDGLPVPSGPDGGMHPQAFSNPALWKTGPLDARWDQSRGVWAAGGSNTKIYLSKITNTYNPPNFSYEVERSRSRDQFTRVGPTTQRAFSSTETIYDPEYLAYTANPDNVGTYELLDYTGLEFPHYEAFIIRQTIDDVGPDYYNIWSEDCQDCGHVSNPCNSGQATVHGSSSVGKKILIENPLKQNLDAGDLCFTVRTGRTKQVNTGSFVGGSGVGASGNVVTNSSGVASFQIVSSGSGYSYGAFGIISSGICASLSLFFASGVMTSGTVSPTTGFPHNKTYPVAIYPKNATISTETLDIHWIINSEFKTQQVVTHVACDGGLLQTCSIKIQSQYSSCEWCGEDSALVN